MQAIRELFINLRSKFDPAGFNQADDKIKSTKDKFIQSAEAIGGVLILNKIKNSLLDVIQISSDFNEKRNAYQNLMGSYYEESMKWAEETGKAIGRNKYTIMDATSQLYGLFTGMGVVNDKALEMSKTMAQVSIDFASMYNIMDEETQRNFISVLSGEAESMKKWGIVVTDTTMQEYALAQGIKAKWSELSNAEKVQLRYQYMMEQFRAKGIIGDAQKTMFEYANSLKWLSDTFKEIQGTVGDFYRSFAINIVHGAIYGLQAFANLDPRLQQMIVTFGGLVVAIGAMGAVLPIIRNIGTALSVFLNPYVLALAGALVLAYLAFDDLKTGMEGGKSAIKTFLDSRDPDAWNNLVSLIKSVGEAFSSIPWGELVTLAVGWINMWWRAYTKYVGLIIDVLKTIKDSVSEFIDWWNGLGGVFKEHTLKINTPGKYTPGAGIEPGKTPGYTPGAGFGLNPKLENPKIESPKLELRGDPWRETRGGGGGSWGEPQAKAKTENKFDITVNVANADGQEIARAMRREIDRQYAYAESQLEVVG